MQRTKVFQLDLKSIYIIIEYSEDFLTHRSIKYAIHVKNPRDVPIVTPYFIGMEASAKHAVHIQYKFRSYEM